MLEIETNNLSIFFFQEYYFLLQLLKMKNFKLTVSYFEKYILLMIIEFQT